MSHGQSVKPVLSSKSTESLRVCDPKVCVDIGTAIAHEELFNIVVISARQPDMAPLFNAASSAWNNAFFFMGIVHNHTASADIAPSISRCSRTYHPQLPPSKNQRRFRHISSPSELNLPNSHVNARIRMGLVNRR
jgi:hypothetical protein